MSTVSLEKLAATVGAEVVVADHDLLLDDPAMPAWTLEALDANGVLVFRDLHLDDATQVAFSKRLGRVETFNMKDQLPEIFLVTLDRAKNPSAQYLKGTFYWHIDGMTEDIPILATLLSAHAVAGEGGETEFASTYQAHDDLTDEELERFSSVRVVHTIEAAQRTFNPDPSPEEVALWRKRPAKEHPLIWQHDSGRRSLVLGATADHIAGMDIDEGRALLADLLARATGPDRVYRHEWQVGDLVIWDNTGVLHRALPYDPASPRDMHRTTLYGKEAVK
jgi:alpha-ketoglutarate-dependent taurine dioxygenase